MERGAHHSTFHQIRAPHYSLLQLGWAKLLKLNQVQHFNYERGSEDIDFYHLNIFAHLK